MGDRTPNLKPERGKTKIVLREHVDHLGERGQVLAVQPGYARNYLLPKGLAFEASLGNLKVLEQQRRVWAAREAREVNDAQALANHLSTISLSTTKKAGEGGTLYGSVTTSEVAEMLAAKGVQVDRRRLLLDQPIKTVGTHKVSVKLHRQVTGNFEVEVVAEIQRETPIIDDDDDDDDRHDD